MKYMTHSKDHLQRETSRCRKNNKCIYGFPHPITPYTWIDDDGCVHFRRTTAEDTWIAPHIPELIDKLDCHIHVDIVSTAAVFSYLFKYLHKGPDEAWFSVRQDNEDEIDEYVRGRYLSSTESSCRILGFELCFKSPSVCCLPIHLPQCSPPRYNGGRDVELESASLLMRYFHRPPQVQFDNLTYINYYQSYVLYKYTGADILRNDEFLETPIPGTIRHKVSPRRFGVKVARIQIISPSAV